MLLYKRNTYFHPWKLNFVLLWSHFLQQSTKLFQCCFPHVEATSMNIRLLNLHFQLAINVEAKLDYWIDVILSIDVIRWNNVDKHASAQLSFSAKFQCWNDIGSSTLNQRNSINVVSTLFYQCWNNVDKCTSAKLSFSTKYQRWSNVDGRWQSTLFQRGFNVNVFAEMVQYKIPTPLFLSWKQKSFRCF